MSALAGRTAPITSSQRRAFLAVLYRDLYVTWRELPAFLAQVFLQALFLLFVFG
jgi:ABC-2 type transport system permease protein